MVKDIMKEIVVGLLSVASIVGIIAFLIRQSIWTRYILPLVSRKPKLSVLFENGQNVMHISKTMPRDLSAAVEISMEKEKRSHPYEHYTEPSYNNPFPQLTEGDSSNKKIYNSLLDDYLKDKELEYKRKHNGEIEDEFMTPIRLILNNKGDVLSGKLNITIDLTPNEHIYTNEARKSSNADSIEAPMCMPDGVFPLLAYKRIPYSYINWDFGNCIEGVNKYAVDPINHHNQGEHILDTLYIDTRFEGKVTLSVRIVDSTVKDPYESEIVLFVDSIEQT